MKVDVQGLSYSQLIPGEIDEIVTLNLACNNEANLVHTYTLCFYSDKPFQNPPSGSKTDQAVLEFFESYHKDYKSIQQKFIGEETTKFSFSSNRKRSAVIINLDSQTLLCKGAAEYILAASNYVQNKDVRYCLFTYVFLNLLKFLGFS